MIVENRRVVQKIYCILLILVFSSFSLAAQEFMSVKGRVVNMQDGSGIPYTLVKVSGEVFGAVSDENGYFDLQLPASNQSETVQLVCSSVGFQTTNMSFSWDEKDVVIEMRPTSLMLDEVVIYADQKTTTDPGKIIQKAIKSLKKTTGSFLASASFTHQRLENGVYTKLLEGKVQFQDNKGFGKNLPQLVRDERVMFLEKRESLDHSSSKIVFEQTEVDLFGFLWWNPLRYKYNKQFDYAIEDTLFQNHTSTYLISASQSRDTVLTNNNSRVDMKFYLIKTGDRKNDFQIVRCEVSQQRKIEVEGFVIQQSRFFTVDMEPSGDFLMPAKFEYSVIQNGTKGEEVTSYYNLTFDEVRFKYNAEDIVQRSVSNYDPKYWSANHIDKKIINDLNSEIPLEKQFEYQSNGELRSDIQKDLEMNQYKSLLNNATGNEVFYVIIWDDWEQIKNIDSRRLLQLKEEKNISAIFVSTLNDESMWENVHYFIPPVCYFPGFHFPENMSRLELSNCDNSFPQYLLIRNGEVEECQSEPLLN